MTVEMPDMPKLVLVLAVIGAITVIGLESMLLMHGMMMRGGMMGSRF